MQQGGATGVRCPHARQRLRQSARSTSQPRSAKWHARGLLPRAHVSLLTSAIAPGSPPSQPPCSAPPSAPPTSSRDRIIHRFRWPVTRNLLSGAESWFISSAAIRSWPAIGRYSRRQVQAKRPLRRVEVIEEIVDVRDLG